MMLNLLDYVYALINHYHPYFHTKKYLNVLCFIALINNMYDKQANGA